MDVLLQNLRVLRRLAKICPGVLGKIRPGEVTGLRVRSGAPVLGDGYGVYACGGGGAEE
jgi:hypothetical protein